MLVNQASENQFTDESAILIYSEAFPPAGFSSIDFHLKHKDYLKQPLVMATSFLGLPNQKRNSDTLTAADIFYNMIDWDVADQARGKLSKLDAVLAVPMFLYHVIRMLIKIPFNIAQVFTEFLPGLAEEACRVSMVNANDKSLAYYAAKTGYVFFNALHFIGRAVTSPIKAMFAASEKDSEPHWAMIDVTTSGVIYGVAFTVAIALISPIATVPMALLLYKIFIISLGTSAIFTMGVVLSSLVSMVIEDGVVKPLLQALGNVFGLDSARHHDDVQIEESASKMLDAMPPNQTPLESKDLKSSRTEELPKKPEPTEEPPKQFEPVINADTSSATNFLM